MEAETEGRHGGRGRPVLGARWPAKPSLIEKFQIKVRNPVSEQGRQHLRNDTQGCPLASACICNRCVCMPHIPTHVQCTNPLG